MENKRYLLAIKKIHWQPEPIDWSQFPNYKNQDINDLKNIDDFTSEINEDYLRHLLVELNMNNPEELTEDFVIRHYENGALRDLIYGPMFKDNADFKTSSAIIEFLIQNKYDKDILNRIYNIFKNFNKTMGQTPAFKDFIHALNNLDPENLVPLNNLHYIDYVELRSLGMFISKNLISKVKNNINEIPEIIPPEEKDIQKELMKKKD